MKGNGLKAYLETKHIKVKKLAQDSGISKSYLYMVLNNERTNLSPFVLSCLSNNLGLSLEKIKQLLNANYKEYIEEPNEIALIEFREYLSKVLDALDINDQSQADYYTEKIKNLDNSLVPLTTQFFEWYDAWHLAFENRFNEAIEKFHNAQDFKPKTDIERRFKAKIIGGLGGAYIAKGNYKKAMIALRLSLFLWPNGKQAGWVHLNTGTLFRRMHRYERAIESFNRAYDLGAAFIGLFALSSLIQICFDVNDLKAAHRYVVRGYLYAKGQEESRGKGDLYCNIAEYYVRINKPNRAEKYYSKAIKYSGLSGDSRIKHWAIVELAKLYLKLELIEKLNFLLGKYNSEITSSADILVIGNHLNVLGEAYITNHQITKAILILLESYKLLNFIKPSQELLECCNLLITVASRNRTPFEASFYAAEIKRIEKSMNH